MPVAHPSASPTSSPRQAHQRLRLQLEQKDAQLGKLRGVVRELEGKLIDAYKRQADLSVWGGKEVWACLALDSICSRVHACGAHMRCHSQVSRVLYASPVQSLTPHRPVPPRPAG